MKESTMPNFHQREKVEVLGKGEAPGLFCKEKEDGSKGMKTLEKKPDLTQILPLITEKTPSLTLTSQKRRPEKSVHASKRAVLCRGIGCKVKFIPVRRNQVFCSPACRIKYFATARTLGVMILEKSGHSPELKTIVDKLSQ